MWIKTGSKFETDNGV